MRLLDLFCGAGGCSVGYHRAGFTDIVGVDLKPQPRYPFRFVQADALEFLATVKRGDFDLIHASPPCQAFARVGTHHRGKHRNLIPEVREQLQRIGTPYVIENVEDARRELQAPVMLCGSMFALGVWRHRYFECSELVMAPPMRCDHSFHPVLITGTTRRLPRRENTVAECRVAADIPWMTRSELDQAIPPAYTEYIGRAILAATPNGEPATAAPER